VSASLILASGSPRRARILESMGLAFRVVVTQADEALRPGEEATAAAERLARLKAACVEGEALPVLAADTLVTCAGRILGKPKDVAEAAEMLRLLSGRAHEVVTGVCLAHGGRAVSGVERTTVRFVPLTPQAVEWYVGTGEPLDKAGAYHVDGRGAAFIESIEGSPSNVAGLPVRLMLSLAQELGISLVVPRAG
jgi:septum formation protein